MCIISSHPDELDDELGDVRFAMGTCVMRGVAFGASEFDMSESASLSSSLLKSACAQRHRLTHRSAIQSSCVRLSDTISILIDNY